VWSGGGKYRKIRKFTMHTVAHCSRLIAVSHCVHDECHMTPSSTEPETRPSQAAVWQCKLWHDLVWYCLCSVCCITIVYTANAGWPL